jgi:hypothetical protein
MKVTRLGAAGAVAVLMTAFGGACAPTPGPECASAKVVGHVDLAKFPDVFSVQLVETSLGSSTDVGDPALGPNGEFEITVPAVYDDDFDSSLDWSLPSEFAVNGVSSQLFVDRWSDPFQLACGQTVSGVVVGRQSAEIPD